MLQTSDGYITFINYCSQNSQTQRIGYLASNFSSVLEFLDLIVAHHFTLWLQIKLHEAARLWPSGFDYLWCIRVTKVCTNCCASLNRVSTRMFKATWVCLICSALFNVLRVVATCKNALLVPSIARSRNTNSKQHAQSVASLTHCKCKFEITAHHPHIHWSHLHLSLNYANKSFSPSMTCQKCTISEYPLTKKSCFQQDRSRIAPAIQASRHAHGVHNGGRTTLYTDSRAHRQRAPTVLFVCTKHATKCVCVCVCLSACPSVRLSVCLYLSLYVSMYLSISACMHACMYGCVYVCMCVYVCVCVCVYVCMYVRTYVCMYVCMYVSMYVCMYVCTYVRTYVCMHACMHVCISCI